MVIQEEKSPLLAVQLTWAASFYGFNRTPKTNTHSHNCVTLIRGSILFIISVEKTPTSRNEKGQAQ